MLHMILLLNYTKYIAVVCFYLRNFFSLIYGTRNFLKIVMSFFLISVGNLKQRELFFFYPSQEGG